MNPVTESRSLPRWLILRSAVAAAVVCVRLATVSRRLRHAVAAGVRERSGLLAVVGCAVAGGFLVVPASASTAHWQPATRRPCWLGAVVAAALAAAGRASHRLPLQDLAAAVLRALRARPAALSPRDWFTQRGARGGRQSAGVRGLRAGLARGDLLPRVARPATEATELESLLHQAQLQALRSQLNPHFLFNALHSIAELVHENPEACRAADRPAGGAAAAGACSRRRVQELTLAEELDFIRGYVEIEQMRLGERLRVIWDVQPEALDRRGCPA